MNTSTGEKPGDQGAFVPGELVDYSEGAIVSRTLHHKEAGTLTVFAFDAGQGLSEHTTPHDAFILVLEGAAEVTIGGVSRVVGAGKMVAMPANVPHAVQARGRFKMLLVMIKA
ncbi:MAG: cupin domain-containing protein [Promethearchaeota archaeon]